MVERLDDRLRHVADVVPNVHCPQHRDENRGCDDKVEGAKNFHDDARALYHLPLPAAISNYVNGAGPH